MPNKCPLPCLTCLRLKSCFTVPCAISTDEAPGLESPPQGAPCTRSEAEGSVTILLCFTTVTPLKMLGASRQDSFPFTLEASEISEPHVSLRCVLCPDLKSETSGPSCANFLCPHRGGGWRQAGRVAGGWLLPTSPRVKAELSRDGKASHLQTGRIVLGRGLAGLLLQE